MTACERKVVQTVQDQFNFILPSITLERRRTKFMGMFSRVQFTWLWFLSHSH